MADAYTIELDLKGMQERLAALGGPKFTRTILSAVRLTMQGWLRATVQKMSGPYLGVVTGTARRSMISTSVASADTVIGRFGSPLIYVRAHELGFSGSVQVAAHTRMLTGNIKKAKIRLRKAQRRLGADEPIDLRNFSGFGSFKRTAFVRAHTRRVDMWARRFMRDSIAEDQPKLNDRMRRAILMLARTGKPPTVGELGAQEASLLSALARAAELS
jgi:hypothetical protein